MQVYAGILWEWWQHWGVAAAKRFIIRKRQFPKLKGPRYEVDCGIIDRRRVRWFFHTRDDANEYADRQKGVLRSHGESSAALSEPDRILFQAARDQVAAVGATINQAVDYYLASHKPLRATLSLRELFDKAFLEKELASNLAVRQE